MLRRISSVLFFTVTVFLVSCKKDYGEKPGRKKVEVLKMKGEYTLYKDGKPYYIKGAGGFEYMDKVRKYGGNSIRVWTTKNADSILDAAHSHGLSVILGLDVLSERHGFDYNDTSAVRIQFEAIKQTVMKYKSHPALLMWGIGNELDVFSAKVMTTNLKVWEAVNDIARMIHEVDPDHPTTTMVVPYRRTIWYVKWKCPHIDVLSINTFGGLSEIPSKIREPLWGWNGPYIISEWGPWGWWEVERTIWDAPIEASTNRKAEFYKDKYNSAIKTDTQNCLGSYVFYWGQKNEKTPTWFSMFTEDGRETEAVQLMHELWTDQKSFNKYPQINDMFINNKRGESSIFLRSGDSCIAEVVVSDPEHDSLIYQWEILPDLMEEKGGGDQETKVIAIPGLFFNDTQSSVWFKAPLKEGAYRIFVYVSDTSNKVAIKNIPFYVVE